MFIKDTQVLGIVLEQLFKKKIIYMLNIYNILSTSTVFTSDERYFLKGMILGGVSHFLLQRIFLTQGLNLCLLHLQHWLADSSPLCNLGNPCLTITFS